MDAEERLRIRLLREAHEQLTNRGEAHLGRSRVSELASEEGADEKETEHVLRMLIEENLLEERRLEPERFLATTKDSSRSRTRFARPGATVPVRTSEK
jgi:hypothetical protein